MGPAVWPRAHADRGRRLRVQPVDARVPRGAAPAVCVAGAGQFCRPPGAVRIGRSGLQTRPGGGAGGGGAHVCRLSAGRDAGRGHAQCCRDSRHDFAHGEFCAATRGAAAGDGAGVSGARRDRGHRAHRGRRAGGAEQRHRGVARACGLHGASQCGRGARRGLRRGADHQRAPAGIHAGARLSARRRAARVSQHRPRPRGGAGRGRCDRARVVAGGGGAGAHGGAIERVARGAPVRRLGCVFGRVGQPARGRDRARTGAPRRDRRALRNRRGGRRRGLHHEGGAGPADGAGAAREHRAVPRAARLARAQSRGQSLGGQQIPRALQHRAQIPRRRAQKRSAHAGEPRHRLRRAAHRPGFLFHGQPGQRPRRHRRTSRRRVQPDPLRHGQRLDHELPFCAHAQGHDDHAPPSTAHPRDGHQCGPLPRRRVDGGAHGGLV